MRKKTGPISKFKKVDFIFILFISIITILTPVVIVYSTAYLSSVNVEVEKLKSEIEKQENINAGLAMQVDELASLSNIQNLALENGLSYNNDNIILIK